MVLYRFIPLKTCRIGFKSDLGIFSRRRPFARTPQRRRRGGEDVARAARRDAGPLEGDAGGGAFLNLINKTHSDASVKTIAADVGFLDASWRNYALEAATEDVKLSLRFRASTFGQERFTARGLRADVGIDVLRKWPLPDAPPPS